jgi:hypothetical protein
MTSHGDVFSATTSIEHVMAMRIECSVPDARPGDNVVLDVFIAHAVACDAATARAPFDTVINANVVTVDIVQTKRSTP